MKVLESWRTVKNLGLGALLAIYEAVLFLKWVPALLSLPDGERHPLFSFFVIAIAAVGPGVLFWAVLRFDADSDKNDEILERLNEIAQERDD